MNPPFEVPTKCWVNGPKWLRCSSGFDPDFWSLQDAGNDRETLSDIRLKTCVVAAWDIRSVWVISRSALSEQSVVLRDRCMPRQPGAPRGGKSAKRKHRRELRWSLAEQFWWILIFGHFKMQETPRSPVRRTFKNMRASGVGHTFGSGSGPCSACAHRLHTENFGTGPWTWKRALYRQRREKSFQALLGVSKNMGFHPPNHPF